MKLLSITLKNFLSYGNEEQTMHFDQSGIIAFTGNNGHGKSAILEAITWGCWGQARKGQGVSKSDDMIMHLGSTHMSVIITIQVNDTIYKIHRSCQKKYNRLNSQIELYSIIDNHEHNLSQGHQKDTQQLINTIIGIDYDMFINTVYVKQGASDEFSKKTPKERKDILCTILKIDAIENTRQKIIEDTKNLINTRDVALQIENKLLSQKQEEEIAEIINLKNCATEKLTSLELSLKNALTISTTKKTELHTMSNSITHIKNKIATEEHKIQALYNQYLIKKTLYEEYKKSHYSLAMIEKKNRTDTEPLELLLEKKILLTKNFDSDIQNLEMNLLNAEEKYTNAMQKIVQEETNFLENTQSEHINGITKKIQSNTYHIMLIDTSLESHTCQLCSSNTINREYLEENKHNLTNQNKTNLDTLHTYTCEKNQYIETYKNKKIAILEEKKIHINEIQSLIAQKKHAYRTMHSEYEDKIASYNNHNSIHVEKDILKKSIDKFLAEKHRDICKQIIYSIYTHKKTIHDHEQEMNIRNKQLEHANAEHAEQLGMIIDIEKQIQEITSEITKLDSWLIILNKQLEEKKSELQKIQQNIIMMEETIKIKSNLIQILSKNNLQAAIIEEALPLIEKEANLILERLTQGKSRIYIESMRDLKSGTIKETLDIKICDEIGIRYYEFFSGGEAFRIDLALRIALIKLLTQKSGNLVKTFIIDEGFGSQDTQNLELIIEMLHILQNEFDLIIIISHLQDMKDHFTSQFFIEKTVIGSQIKKL
jgi:exonuclease SbcC